MEQVYSAFHNYDFLSDADFMSGWNGINQHIPDASREEQTDESKNILFL